MSMFCFQCEQTAKGTGCTVQGVCGKSPEVAALLDLVVYAAKGISQYAHRLAALGAKRDHAADIAVVEALFATVTNVDFDPERLRATLTQLGTVRDHVRRAYEHAAKAAGKPVEKLTGPAGWQPEKDLAGLIRQGQAVGVLAQLDEAGPDVSGLKELILYGLKGTAAYAEHAHVLGKEDPAVFAGFHQHLDFLTRKDPDLDDLLGAALAVGQLNLTVMALLDEANTSAYGVPVPTQVRVTPVKGKAILISGHDLHDLKLLLDQTAGKGINIYTHSEMLPAHAYPELKKYPHLVANFGGAWQDQRKEFKDFPGAFLFTTNCIQQPDPSYKDRVFTTGLVGWPGCTNIGESKDFSAVIAAALKAPGFAADAPEKHITVGFNHRTVMGVADKVIEAVRAGKIRHFFLVGGCDGAKPGRNYYTEFAEKVPVDCVILTLACGKYRFNKREFGHIGGIPRLLDMGQCNDAYSAIKVASALAEAFNCGVNDLPLSLVLSWYEQKAVAILLTLLHLGVRNIRLGPSLPAFVTPAVLNVLVEKFAVKPISTPEADLTAILHK